MCRLVHIKSFSDSRQLMNCLLPSIYSALSNLCFVCRSHMMRGAHPLSSACREVRQDQCKGANKHSRKLIDHRKLLKNALHVLKGCQESYMLIPHPHGIVHIQVREAIWKAPALAVSPISDEMKRSNASRHTAAELIHGAGMHIVFLQSQICLAEITAPSSLPDLQGVKSTKAHEAYGILRFGDCEFEAFVPCCPFLSLHHRDSNGQILELHIKYRERTCQYSIL